MALQLLITLREVNPSVWRRIIIPRDFSFFQLHLAIQQAFGWMDCHLFQFSEHDIMDEVFIAIPDEEASQMEAIDANTKGISDIFQKEGDRYTYVYDFGDNWEHDIILEAILPGEIEHPICAAGAGACPPEDVGGVKGYQRMMTIFESSDEEEKQSYREWLGLSPDEKWNPNLYEVRKNNNPSLLF